MINCIDEGSSQIVEYVSVWLIYNEIFSNTNIILLINHNHDSRNEKYTSWFRSLKEMSDIQRCRSWLVWRRKDVCRTQSVLRWRSCPGPELSQQGSSPGQRRSHCPGSVRDHVISGPKQSCMSGGVLGWHIINYFQTPQTTNIFRKYFTTKPQWGEYQVC